MLEWAKSIRDFAVLPVEDQLVLLKRFAISYLILEHGCFTVRMGVPNVWMISNGTCMPRDCDLLPEESKVSNLRVSSWIGKRARFAIEQLLSETSQRQENGDRRSYGEK
jgi:hypothetical protein